MFLLKIPERLYYTSFLVNLSLHFYPLFRFAFFLPGIFIFLNCSSVPFLDGFWIKNSNRKLRFDNKNRYKF
ncbi:hypothetical protein A0128_16585 [Leptospira tipperaryensis]|uniref:Uncharacterized protein n=1 Tax=Leptospira tipperaryensis TaxID=2564040 RepID=A0A1D7V0H5_9LEPT|nr:hypothetical protein A0128_16585 [Leptospira tipperaryensis]